MSQEIRPSEAIASLRGINQELNSIINSVVPTIRDSISNFDGNTDLQGKAFDNLRAHMNGEISEGLLNQLVTAVDALRETNSQHILAIMNNISQYSILNWNQIHEELRRVFEQLAFANSNTFSGGGDWIILLNAELAYLRKKSEDYAAYLRASSGLYNGLFTGLEIDTLRMSFATFCNVSGFVSIPTVEEMIFQMEVDRAMDELFPYVAGERQVCWDTLQEVLGRPYTEIREAEFAVLAMLFISFDLGEQERFLNYLIDQIEVPELAQFIVSGEFEGFDPINNRPEDILLYMFCPQKVEGIQRHLNKAIALVWQTEMGLEGGHPDLYYLERLRFQIMERSALLSTVSTMMGEPWGDDTHRVQHVFLGREDGTIQLEYGNPGVMVCSVSVVKSVRTFVDGTSRIDLMSPEDRIMRVDEALDWNLGSHEMINLAETYFTSMHRFDLGAHYASVVAGALFTVLTLGLKKPASIVLKIVETANKAFGSGRSSAEARAERIQGDFSRFADYARTALAFRTFEINVLFVENTTLGGFEMHLWETPITMERVDALNSVAGTEFTMEDISQNLPAIIEAYLNITENRDQLREFYELIGL